MLQALFEIEGHKVYTAGNGLEAVEIAKSRKLDLILMDVKMPFMNGIEALKLIRKSNPNLPVLMMTAYAELNQKVIAKEQGIIDWLHKPLDIEKLKDVVNDILYKEEKDAK
jgi:DNA-binding response OmpR family regulator